MMVFLFLSPLLLLDGGAAHPDRAGPFLPAAAAVAVSLPPGYETPRDGPPVWTDIDEAAFARKNGWKHRLRHYRTLLLDTAALEQVLQAAPAGGQVRNSPALIVLPLPDGSFGRFRFVPVPVSETDPQPAEAGMRTYTGQGIDDPYAGVAFDRTPAGFHALIISETTVVYLEPYRQKDLLHYLCYYKHDIHPGLRRPFEEGQGPVGAGPATAPPGGQPFQKNWLFPVSFP